MPLYRLIQKSYAYGTESEDGPGSLTNIVERSAGSQRVWGGILESQPDDQWFADAGIKIYEDDNHEEGLEPGGPGVIEYSYRLEVFKDGKWKYCDGINAIESYQSDNDDSEPSADETSGHEENGHRW